MDRAFTPQRASALTSTVTWQEALRSFLLHQKATRAPKTVRFYDIQLRMLTNWADSNAVPIDHFGKRHLDAYLVSRSDAGKSQMTLHHDAIAAKVFMKWCVRNDLIERSLLADYQVRSAPRTAMYMPTEEDMGAMLKAVADYWDPAQN